ncbi:alkene reductase [Alteromonas lipolytica]|uniref:Alkene reductase n=1 Tax=Alteromonas lipolytica TaxID=1856405 RepID=A0A1E8FA03_9ALTE|nr:alkene reductase [Alteromonas lipolytica]OFI32739.1 alkene reductase [Alteromonas lipolytica]GGF73509.1 alkene reductase [Alteromonas lipolytica]
MALAHLLSPVTFAGNPLKNRMVLAPLTRGRAGPDRVPNKVMGDYYVQRACGGLLITEATSISPEGNGWVDAPGIYTSEMTAAWRSITERVHNAGSRIVLQMWHTGRASHSDFHQGKLPFSASAIAIGDGSSIHTPAGKKPFEVPQAMSVEDIKRTVEDYRKAAQNAKEAGFDGIEVHAANGYLINQFLDSRSNQREDDYGASLENRYRFLAEVMQAVLDVWPAEKVGVRLSPNGMFNDMGADDYKETYLFVADKLNQLNIGYLHIMDGLAFGFHERGEPMTLQEFRHVFNGLLIGNCGYDKDTAEQRIAGGEADMIAFGRPWISNPDLPVRFARDYPLAPCDDMSHWYGGGAQGYSDYPSYEEASGIGEASKLV